jgi:hypothetical protein
MAYTVSPSLRPWFLGKHFFFFFLGVGLHLRKNFP